MTEIERWINELTSGDDRRAEAAVPELAEFGRAALPALRELLHSPDSDTRWWAVRALAEVDAPEILPLILKALDDPDLSVRQCAALGLRQKPDPQATPALAAALEHEDRLYASLAADALIEIGSPAVPVLLGKLENGPHGARVEAARALAQIGDPQAIPGLFAVLDETALLNHWAEQGLEKMGVGMSFFKP